MANDPTAPMVGENRLFSALPADVSERLRPHTEVVDLALRQSLYTAHEPITHVYFTRTAVCSLRYVAPVRHHRALMFPTLLDVPHPRGDHHAT